MKQKLLILTMIFAVSFGAFTNAYAQKVEALTKDEAINRLTKLTIPPFDEKKLLEEEKKREAEFLKNHTEEEIEEEKKDAEIRRTEDVSTFNEILAKNNHLTDDQKAFIKKNHNEVSDLVNERSIEKRLSQFVKHQKKMHELTIAKFQESLSKNYKAEELNSLIVFFESVEGKQVINIFPAKVAEVYLPKPNGMKIELSDEDKKEFGEYSQAYEKFSKTSQGEKFFNSLIIDGYLSVFEQNNKEVRELLEKLLEMEGDEESDPDKLSESIDDYDLTTDEINKIFNKYIADNFAAQTPDKDLPKEKAVKRLIEMTISSHPMIETEEKKELVERFEAKTLEQLKKTGTKEDLERYEEGQKNMKAIGKEMLKEIQKDFDKALAQNKKLTKDEKSFVKANYPKLMKIWDQINSEKFSAEKFIRKELEKGFTKNYTVRELNEFIGFFQISEGQNVLRAYNLGLTGDENFSFRMRRKDVLGLITPEQAIDLESFEKFAKSPIGEKFEKVFILNPLEPYFEKLGSLLESVGKPNLAEINEMFNRFVEENYTEELEKNGGVTKRIKFAKGKTSITVSEAVIRGDRDTHIIGAKKGQNLTVKITALENNAAFTILTPDKNI